ncbi:MarR family winged helix-turn-helix transcriptional regulator [Clostridium sp. SYSU_GA19001]|uniref:MarR family winged helix-turn-helix transcriptional regulator n=1 Tax=Clostridium caldaquaticum TaxID=2940653 RepID=UPI0020772746|nr:MarR family winged helix-turn-helix transcriptional regulator [Clostridium caldaquaticum]MCM8709433.1 MarR family winged helix-turn-helix transcriptional regulator [Clostridium caldaquaticum]
MNNKQSYYLRELIRVLVRNLGIVEESEATCCGTTVSQCNAIVQIGRAKDVSLNELAELLALDKSTMSRTINKLVDSGLAIREIHPEDRRYVSIKLTDEGLRIFDNIERSLDQYYQRIFLSIPEEKREQVLESLQLIINAAKQNKCC